jgi:hypothetical protein
MARVAEGISTKRELLDQHIHDYKALADAAKEAGGGNSGAEYGTAVHSVVESILKTGEVPAGTPDDVEADAFAAINCLHDNGFEVVAAEIFTVNTAWETAGTADWILRHVESGETFIGDLKTSGNSHFLANRWNASKWSLQMTIYAWAKPWNEKAEIVDWETINIKTPSKHWGLIVHVEKATANAALIQIPLDPDTVELAVTVNNIRKRPVRSTILTEPLT